ncbi:unnamed protein product [Hydatigera taeniaeformis]|uniref:LAM_G_DOMAIN domain-containing protein n=1 Tax=Hydatigena taeniaeformis TaxID=6205 RepID=A0A0R3WTN7_HYDTA|nr:unnamed protein product [Hydatigera taeniaeformis]
MAAFNLGDQANVHITAGMCGQVPTEDEVSGKQPIQDEFRPGYLVLKGLGMKRLLGDLLVNTEAWASETSVFFTLKIKPGYKGELFAVYSSQGRVLLSVGVDKRVVVAYQEAASGVRAARISATGTTIHREKIGPALDDNEWHRVGLNFKDGRVRLAVDCKTIEGSTTILPVKFIDKRNTLSLLPNGLDGVLQDLMLVQGDRSLEQQCLIYTPDCPADGDDAMMNDEVGCYSRAESPESSLLTIAFLVFPLVLNAFM